MAMTFGQRLKTFRKNEGWTQQDLSEMIGVSTQAISKWETDAGMPDISQIVPLANVFGISTDMLLGISANDSLQKIQNIILNAHKLLTTPATLESARLCYNALCDGAKNYPNNISLLSACLEMGIALAYPENDIYDKENGNAIYKECVRWANIIIKYGENATDILRAHMIMVLLHSAYGDTGKARSHAKEFPWRPDMTLHKMNGYISHFEKNYKEKATHYQYDFIYHLEAMLDDMVELGNSYGALKKYDDAYHIFVQALNLINLICEKEKCPPKFSHREHGDIHCMLAEICIKMNNYTEAIDILEKMVDYYLKNLPSMENKKPCSPLFRDTNFNFYSSPLMNKNQLLLELKSEKFDVLNNNDKFLELLSRVEA